MVVRHSRTDVKGWITLGILLLTHLVVVTALVSEMRRDLVWMKENIERLESKIDRHMEAGR